MQTGLFGMLLPSLLTPPAAFATIACVMVVTWSTPALLLPQTSAGSGGIGPASSSSPDSSRRWWLSGQLNVIYQWHPAFPASYTGTNSLLPAREDAMSRLATLYSGLRVGARTEVLLDLETAGGGGISKALGLAGFTNLDVVRDPSLGSAPYVARARSSVTRSRSAPRPNRARPGRSRHSPPSPSDG